MSPSSSRGQAGKRFEQDFQNSVPLGVYKLRLRDCGGWGHADSTRFTPSNPYDLILFSQIGGAMFALELKSTSGALRFDAVSDTQYKGLLDAHQDGVIAGIVVNFRREHETYFIDLTAFTKLDDGSAKKSFNATDAAKIGTLLPRQKLAKNRRPRYDITPLLALGQEDIYEKDDQVRSLGLHPRTAARPRGD